MTDFDEAALSERRRATVTVTPELIADFAAAIRETGAADDAPVAQSPLCATAPAAAAIADIMRSVPPAALARQGLLTELHVTMHRPLEPGMELVTEARVLGIRPRPRGAQMTVIAESLSKGELVSEQLVTLSFPGADSAELGDAPPALQDVRGQEPDITVRTASRPSQPEEYARATGDRAPVHFDEELARRMGLRGVIMHGTCTLAAVVDTLSRTSRRDARRIAARFRAPVYPADIVVTRAVRLAPHTTGFISTSNDIDVLSHGVVEWS